MDGRFNVATMTCGHDEVRGHARVRGRERGADEPAGHCTHAPHRVQPVHDRSLTACVDADRDDVHRDVLHAIRDPGEHLGGDEPADRRRHHAQGEERGDRESRADRGAARADTPDEDGRAPCAHDAAEREGHERDAEAADARAELRRELRSGREPHGRGDAIDEERGADAPHHHRVRAGPRRLRP